MTSSSRSPAQALEDILVTARLQQAMSVAATLGVPDVLANGPRAVGDIAESIGANESALYRLLATLAAGGILHEGDDRRFGLTDIGELLRSNVPGSKREWAILNGKAYMREGWSNLEHSIRTGENAFTALHGESVWAWRAARPEESAAFDRTMAANSGPVAQAVAEAYDFGSLGTLVDVGGGTGTLLATILRRHATLRGILFDQPHVAGSDVARALIEREGVAERCEIVAGSFFESVPAGAGGYLMKWILHDWEDPEATRILQTIRNAATPTSRLLVVELVIGPPNEDLSGHIMDLHMMVIPGGRERTEGQWRSLFGQGGWRLDEIASTATPLRILVGSPE